MKIAALIFLLFLLFIVFAADAGRLPSVFRSLYDFPNGDRVGHVVIYGVLAFLVASAFPRKFRLGRVFLPIATVALVAFCFLEECSQSFFSTRTPDGIDLTCSFIGILFGTWAAYRWKIARKT